MALSRILCLLLLIFSFSKASALDISKEYLLLYLKDKDSVSLEELSKSFSQASLERRERQRLTMDSIDFPVNQKYVDQLTLSGIDVVDSSRWLNAVLVAFPKNEKKLLKKISEFDFIESFQFLGGKGKPEEWSTADTLSEYSEVDILYKASLKAIGLDTLHQLGYKGKGIQIALLDAGYIGVDAFESFAQLHKRGQIRKTINFTDTTRNIFNGSIHGTKVLSLLSATNGSKVMGGAPEADFWLMKTEDIDYEHPLEEFYYVKALEYCDQAGIDIVNASIGYYSFDDASFDYRPSDLYARKSVSSNASALAAGRGMLIVTSAGNEGTLKWKGVTFPADAKDIIAVGVASLHGRPTAYASYGKDSIDIIRPNLSAPGHKVYTIDEDGKFSLSFGSSYAAPLITAAAACLWEKYPQLSVTELITLLEKSGVNYPDHQPQTGYGFPDLRKILRELK